MADSQKPQMPIANSGWVAPQDKTGEPIEAILMELWITDPYEVKYTEVVPKALSLIKLEIEKAKGKQAFQIRQMLGTALADYGKLDPPDPKRIIEAVVEHLDRLNTLRKDK